MSAFKKMTLSKKHLIIYLIASLVIALAMTVFRIYMICTEYETETYFFKYGSPLPDIFNYTLVALIVIIFAFFIFTKKKSLPDDYGKTSIPTVITAAATGFLSFIGGLYAASQLLITNDPAGEAAVVSESAQRVETFAFIQCLLSLGVFAYFLLTAFSLHRCSVMKTVFGIIAILWHVVFLLVIYFDMTRPINAPIRLMFQFAILASMIYLIVEMRFLLGIAKPRLFMSVSFISIIIIMSAALPMTVCAIAGLFIMPASNIIYSLHLIAMLGYIISRTVTYIRQPLPQAETAENKNEEN